MIREIFEAVKNLAYQVQNLTQLGLNVDGKAIWGGIESSLADIKIRDGLRYKDELRETYVDMERLIETFGLNRDKMPDHFFTQLKDLVDKKSEFVVKPNRILQIAYNVGQLTRVLEKDKLPREIKEFVYVKRLLEIETYLDEATLSIIDTEFNKMSGGGKKFDLRNLRFLKT
jgi:hypothetical protein